MSLTFSIRSQRLLVYLCRVSIVQISHFFLLSAIWRNCKTIEVDNATCSKTNEYCLDSIVQKMRSDKQRKCANCLLSFASSNTLLFVKKYYFQFHFPFKLHQRKNSNVLRGKLFLISRFVCSFCIGMLQFHWSPRVFMRLSKYPSAQTLLKWGQFLWAKHIFRMCPSSWAEIILITRSRSFLRGIFG